MKDLKDDFIRRIRGKEDRCLHLYILCSINVCIVVPKSPYMEWRFSRLDKMNCPWWILVIFQVSSLLRWSLPHQCIAVCLTSFEPWLGEYGHRQRQISEGKAVTMGKRARGGRFPGGDRTRAGLWGNARTWMGWRSRRATPPRMGPKAGSGTRGLTLIPSLPASLGKKTKPLSSFVFRLKPLEIHTWWLADFPSAMESDTWTRLPWCPCTSLVPPSTFRWATCPRRSWSSDWPPHR